jgi:predicted metal-dependent enzyme (double-stranded beta helix superfamily)
VNQDWGRSESIACHRYSLTFYAGDVRDTVSVASFMAEARELLGGDATDKNLAAIGELLAAVSRVPDFVQEGDMRALHGGSASFTILQSDPDGLTLMLARFRRDEETPIHNHGSWGVACVVHGRDRYRHWKLGNGERVQVLYEKDLGPGEFVTWLDPPSDIHSQAGIGEDATELVLFGRDVTKIPRSYYDAATGEVTTGLPR